MTSDQPPAPTLIAFLAHRRVARGRRDDVLAALRAHEGGAGAVVFDAETGERVELDLRPDAAPTAAVEDAPTRGVGRPKLGVVAREVTLLPRHWDWLAAQPGGASQALRRLVEEARRTDGGRSRVRQAQEAAYAFISAMAGNREGFEEASRALFAGDAAGFTAHSRSWPDDIRSHAENLAADALRAR